MIDVILPALDEATALPLVLPRLPRGYRAIVVDNGSTDATAAVAAELGATVVQEPYTPDQGDEEMEGQIATFSDPDDNYFQLMSPMGPPEGS